MEERNDNYTMMEGYELPSKGLIYDKPVKSHVELRSMTARDEMKRLSPSSTPLKTLADIIDGCLIDKPGIPVYEMCLADYEYLLHKLRIVSYGPEYKVSLRCPDCGELIETSADLESLSLRDFDIDKFNDLRSFTLPRSRKAIVIRPISPKMLDDIDNKTKEMKRRFKTADIDFETLVKLEEVIETVDGAVLPLPELETTINNLPAVDMTKILNNLDRLNQCLGLNNILYLTCPKCGEEFTNFFRFGPEFFRPSSI